MSFLYHALKKAEQEGKVDSSWVPKPVAAPHDEPPEPKLPYDITKDFVLLKQNIQQAHTEHGAQIFAITSSVANEGCTTIAYFLSLLLSQSSNGFYDVAAQENPSGNGSLKKRKGGVLLIEGNFEKPMLHQLFNVTQRPGLMDFIFDRDSHTIMTKATANSSLKLITAGETHRDGRNIWSSEQIKKLLATLRDRFEFILIDAPPVIGHPETLSLCKLTDGVLLVIKANLTRLEVIDQAKQQLQNAGVKVLGVVLNKRKFFIPMVIYKKL